MTNLNGLKIIKGVLRFDWSKTISRGTWISTVVFARIQRHPNPPPRRSTPHPSHPLNLYPPSSHPRSDRKMPTIRSPGFLSGYPPLVSRLATPIFGVATLLTSSRPPHNSRLGLPRLHAWLTRWSSSRGGLLVLSCSS